MWDVCSTLIRAGCEVAVICPQGEESQRAGGERERFERLDGVEIHRYPAFFATGGPTGYLREYAQAMWRTWKIVVKLVRDTPVDVVYSCSPPDFMLFAGWPARRRGARLIFDHHDLTPELLLTRFETQPRILHRLALLAERVSFRAADLVVATNESYAEIARTRGGRSGDDVFVVRNGPDVRRFAPVAPDPALKRGQPLLITYVGVMGPQDGVDHALRALAILNRRRGDFHVVLAGEGDARPELERLTGELGLTDRIEFTGWLDDEQIIRLLSSSDVCLAPEPKTPLNEVSTMVKIAEYMAMARPVVAYDLRESRLTAGEAGVYAQANDVAAYARGIEQLLDDSGRRQAMGAAGRRRAVDSLSWEQSERTLLRVFERALA